MAVVQLTNWQITAGRNAEFLALVAEAKKIHEGLGARVRVFQATFAGPNTGTITYVMEHNDLGALASFGAKVQADSAWQAFVQKAFTTNPTGRLLSSSVANEI